MGIFSGRPKNQMFAGIPQMGPYDTPGIGDGMIERQQIGGYDQNAAMMGQSGFTAPMQPQGNPLSALDGYSRDAAMQGQSGFAPMNVGFTPPAEAKKKGVNWAGIAADFLSGMAGQPGAYAAQQQHERAMQQRAQMAEQQRQQEREDFIWKSQYERDNPKPTSPYRWESNDGSLMEIGPDGQPRQVYKDPTKRPEYRQGPDGRFYPIDTATGPLPTFTADDWNKGQPLGGSVGNGTGGFR